MLEEDGRVSQGPVMDEEYDSACIYCENPVNGCDPIKFCPFRGIGVRQ